jgi:hypothetical protein
VSVFTAIPFFQEREKLEELETKVEQTKRNYQNCRNRILALLSEIDENTELAYEIKQEKEQEFEQVWNNQLLRIKEIMGRIETSESYQIR